MENENENLDSLNEENENVNSENDNQGEPDLEALKKDKEILSDKNKKLFARAKNNEEAAKTLREQGFEMKDGKWIKKEEPPKNLEKSQSNEPDYARLAFLEHRGVTHPDDQKIVQDEANRLKLPLTDVLQMEHIKSKLQDNKDQREALAGMPKGRGNAGGKGQQDVDYWLQKGETPDDQELAEKVIETRMRKEQSANKFSDELYTG